MATLRRLALVALFAGGCAHTGYVPEVVARGELVLLDGGQLEAWGGHRRVARGPEWSGLAPFVRCVGEAERHARAAHANGRASLALAIAGGTLSVASLASLGGIADESRRAAWLGAGAGVAAVGVVLAGFSQLLRNRANGHAVDAVNLYNDAAGARGATCDDVAQSIH